MVGVILGSSSHNRAAHLLFARKRLASGNVLRPAGQAASFLRLGDFPGCLGEKLQRGAETERHVSFAQIAMRDGPGRRGDMDALKLSWVPQLSGVAIFCPTCCLARPGKPSDYGGSGISWLSG